MRTCNCTGYLTNPGGVCCMDLPRGGTVTTSHVTITPPLSLPLTEERLRQIIREEIARDR